MAKEIEGMWPLVVAVEKIPMPSLAALYNFLQKHKDEFPRRYRGTSNGQGCGGRWWQRFLSDSEILRIRAMQFHSIEATPFYRSGRQPSTERRHPSLGWIADRASR